jgi:hypothetical protein
MRLAPNRRQSHATFKTLIKKWAVHKIRELWIAAPNFHVDIVSPFGPFFTFYRFFGVKD